MVMGAAVLFCMPFRHRHLLNLLLFSFGLPFTGDNYRNLNHGNRVRRHTKLVTAVGVLPIIFNCKKRRRKHIFFVLHNRSRRRRCLTHSHLVLSDLTHLTNLFFVCLSFFPDEPFARVLCHDCNHPKSGRCNIVIVFVVGCSSISRTTIYG